MWSNFPAKRLNFLLLRARAPIFPAAVAYTHVARHFKRARLNVKSKKNFEEFLKVKMGGKHKWPVPVQVHVVKEYSKNPGISDTTVKRSVRTKFYPHNPRFLRKTAARDFRKIFDRFEKHGTYVHHTSAAASGMPKRSPNEVIGEQVESYFEENPTHSLRTASRELEIPYSTVRYCGEKVSRIWNFWLFLA